MQKEISKIPQEGNEETIFTRLREFIEPVDAEWIEKIKPASEESIWELYDILGMKDLHLELPESFIEFARNAGESDGGLLLNTLRGELSISKLKSRIKKKIYIHIVLFFSTMNWNWNIVLI